MSDTLRTRIAAVICDMDALHAKQWSLDVADAVIEALDLANPCATDGCRMRRLARDGFGKYGENYGI